MSDNEFTKVAACEMLTYKDEQGTNTKINKFNSKMDAWRDANPETIFDLKWANFGNADLQRAHLQNTDLQGACLQGAKLQKTKFLNADLLRANFKGAFLQGADLRANKIDTALFKGAKYDVGEHGTKFPEGFDPEAHGMKLVNENLLSTSPAEKELAVASGVSAREHPNANLGGSEIIVGVDVMEKRTR